MSNAKMYKAYQANLRKPVLMDGLTFIEMVMQKGYAPELLDVRLEEGVCFHIPSFSFNKAMEVLTTRQKEIVKEHMHTLKEGSYIIFDFEDELPCRDDEVEFVSCALQFKEKHPNMRMEVSSHRIWQLFRIAIVQKMSDSDLL